VNRRSFMVGAGISALAVPRIAFAAQDSTPGATPAATPATEGPYIADFLGSVIRPDLVVYREYEVPSLSLADSLGGDLYSISSYGMRFMSRQPIVDFAPEHARAFIRWLTEVQKYKASPLVRTGVRVLGDESWAWSCELDKGENTWSWGYLAVRRFAELQVLVGLSHVGSPITILADVSEKTLDRWPDIKPASIIDEIHIGNIWSILPTLDDVPEGMGLIEEFKTHF